MSEYETWKVGDTLATYRTGTVWGFLDVPWIARVVAVHGKRDVTIRRGDHEERGTRVGLARVGWKLITDKDRKVIALEKARNACLDAIEEATTKVRGEENVARLDALAAAIRGWL